MTIYTNTNVSEKNIINFLRSTKQNGGSAIASAVPSRPGMIDNSTLIQSPPAAYRNVTVLTGEGGKLKSGSKLVRGRDYELVPERLWKFLSDMYGGSPALPRQVIRYIFISKCSFAYNH